jgi:hypothetical protein
LTESTVILDSVNGNGFSPRCPDGGQQESGGHQLAHRHHAGRAEDGNALRGDRGAELIRGESGITDGAAPSREPTRAPLS